MLSRSLFRGQPDVVRHALERRRQPDMLESVDRVVELAALSLTVISGTVRDATDLQPIAGVVVSVVGLPLRTRTDANGDYVLFFNIPSPGLQNLQIKATVQGQHKSEAAAIREGQTTSNINITVP